MSEQREERLRRGNKETETELGMLITLQNRDTLSICEQRRAW